MTDNKKGATLCESAPQNNQTGADSTAGSERERGMSGGALIEALGWVSFGAWAATVALWLVEVLS